jgi:hypothetical protein
MESNSHDVQAEAQVSLRKRWEVPSIVLERSLEVSAQGGPPGGAPKGFLGPLSASGGNNGGCV